MNKEVILVEIQDLILTLLNNNTQNPTILVKWRQKHEKVVEAIKGLDTCELLWLSSAYSLWHETNIKSRIDPELAKIIEREKFSLL